MSTEVRDVIVGTPPRRNSRPGIRREVIVFAVIGGATTVLHLGGFVLLRALLASSLWANTVALVGATMVNTWANGRWTFSGGGCTSGGDRGTSSGGRASGRPRGGFWRAQVQGLAVLALTLVFNSAGLTLLHAVLPGAHRMFEVAVIAATTLLSTALKFVVLRTWTFAA